MTDAQFYNSFSFVYYRHRYAYTNDMFRPSGVQQHFFCHILHGSVTLVSAEDTIYLKENDYFFIPKGLQYRSHWLPDSEGRIHFFCCTFDFFLADDNVNYKLQKLSCTDHANMLMQQLELNPTRSPHSISLLYQFLAEMYPHMQTHTPSTNELIINKALNYMRQTENYSIKDVAEHCGLCESSLYIKFRKLLNQTPIDTRHKILTERASLLLQTTDLTVEEISNQLGFSSSSYFRRVFCKQVGKTPSQYRKEARRI